MRKFSTNSTLFIPLLVVLLLSLSNYQAISQSEPAVADSASDTENEAVTDSSSDDKRKTIIYYFQLHEDIMPAARRKVAQAMDAAKENNADIIIMELNTYGGRVDIADSIRNRLLNAKPLTVSYIIDNAASAGALISIACDSIYMKEAATIGAVTVVDQTGAAMPDKYQSYMRAKMRATAEAQGRDPDIAEAMVDDRIVIPGIIDSGKTLTFSAKEALTHDFCDAIVTSLEDVIKELGVDDYEIIEHQISGMDKVINFLLNPAVSSILMLMIFGGIYFELQTPGIGFPLAAAIIGATLYFAPLYLEGMAQNWEIVLFFLGIILIAVEIFVLPGFGAAGSAGIALIVGSLTLSLIQNDVFDFSMSGMDEIGIAFLRVVLTLFGGIALMLAFGGSLMKTAAFQRITLQDEQKSDEGYTISDVNLIGLIGQQAVAITDLRPSGKIELEGEIYDAMSEGGYIERDATIKILSIEANTLIVRQIS